MGDNLYSAGLRRRVKPVSSLVPAADVVHGIGKKLTPIPLPQAVNAKITAKSSGLRKSVKPTSVIGVRG